MANQASITPTGDPPLWPYNHHGPIYDQQIIGQTFPDTIWLEDITKRLDNLEKIIDRLGEEEKVRKKNPFVQELYDQYKVALILLEEPDDSR